MLKTTTFLTAVAFAAPALAQGADPVPQGAPDAPQFEPAFDLQTRAPERESDVTLSETDLATGLVHPWGIASLPDEGYLVTERPGRLRHMGADGTLSDPIRGLPEIDARKQGGLLDVTIGPDFAQDRMVYWTYAKPVGDGLTATAAARGVLSDDRTELTDVEDIFVQRPGSTSPMHYGARIVLDGDGHAFITTGEHFTQTARLLAQQTDNTYGKVVRVNLDGSTPEGNPFVSTDAAMDVIWSLGHRNIQGAAIEPGTGLLWAIEHGPKGGDELNIVEAGANYGWPEVSYGVNYDGTDVGTGNADHAAAGFVEPRYYWDPVIAPGGMIFYTGEMLADWQGNILASGLVSQGLVRLELDGDRVTGEERLLDGIGRVRDVEQAADGALLLLIDAEDGRVVRVTAEPEAG